VHFKLNDRRSALDDLYQVLRCNKNLFDARLHESAIQTLAEFQNARISSEINWEIVCRDEVTFSHILLKLIPGRRQCKCRRKSPGIRKGRALRSARNRRGGVNGSVRR
jgi:hypothetical protein